MADITFELIRRERERVRKQLERYKQTGRVQRAPGDDTTLVMDVEDRIVRAVYAGLTTSASRTTRVNQLVHAAALIVAEIERLQTEPQPVTPGTAA